MNKKYYIAMPNISNGDDPKTIEQIINVAQDVEGVFLVKYEPNISFNRTVINLIGEEEPLMNVLINIAGKCKELIDMRKHIGSHPRMGALDIVPIYPFKNTTMDEAIEYVNALGKRMFEELQVPIFFTGANTNIPERQNYVNLRRGQYEGLKALLKEIKDCPQRSDEYLLRAPDYSVDGLLSETYGGTLLNAVATCPAFHNIYLDTENLDIAKAIAKTIRSSTGGFSTVTAIGIKFDEHSGTVVSLNISDCGKTPIYRPFEVVKREAQKYGAQVVGSELVGVVRLDPIVECAKYLLQMNDFETSHIMETHLM